MKLNGAITAVAAPSKQKPTMASCQCDVLLVALELLTGKDQHDTGQTAENVALVPLGTPLLAGPGAIVATMVFSRQVDSSGTFWAVALGVVLVHLALWLAMRFAVPVLQILGNSGVLLLTKIAGILLSAIAIQMIANSIKAFIAVG